MTPIERQEGECGTCGGAKDIELYMKDNDGKVTMPCFCSPPADAKPDPKPEGWREKAAEAAHQIWSHWIRHVAMLDRPQDYNAHWSRLSKTPYHELTEQEKESDRKVADLYINELRNAALDEAAGVIQENWPEKYNPRRDDALAAITNLKRLK